MPEYFLGNSILIHKFIKILVDFSKVFPAKIFHFFHRNLAFQMHKKSDKYRQFCAFFHINCSLVPQWVDKSKVTVISDVYFDVAVILSKGSRLIFNSLFLPLFLLAASSPFTLYIVLVYLKMNYGLLLYFKVSQGWCG